MTNEYENLLLKLAWQKRRDILATPNLACDACNEKRRHTKQEFTKFHANAGSERKAEYDNGMD